MPWYLVPVQYDYRYIGTVRVEADDPEEAESLAEGAGVESFTEEIGILDGELNDAIVTGDAELDGD
ncbi:MAG: hypothetical protein ACYTAN_10350 [Planctomycetota bacterium]|jgi:hypothetical protein